MKDNHPPYDAGHTPQTAASQMHVISMGRGKSRCQTFPSLPQRLPSGKVGTLIYIRAGRVLLKSTGSADIIQMPFGTFSSGDQTLGQAGICIRITLV